MNQEPIEKQCKECDLKYMTTKANKRFCDDCNKKRRKAKRIMYNDRYYKKKTNRLREMEAHGIFAGTMEELLTCEDCGTICDKKTIGIIGVGMSLCKKCFN